MSDLCGQAGGIMPALYRLMAQSLKLLPYLIPGITFLCSQELPWIFLDRLWNFDAITLLGCTIFID